MKLRNKKTGEIFDGSVVVCLEEENGRFAIKDNPVCESISELNARFEDYIPKEPLIENEKIRKAVRAWAEVNEADEIIMAYSLEYDEYLLYTNNGAKIKFNIPLDLKGGSYTIAELCGEEEDA